MILIELDELKAVKSRHMPEKDGKWVPNLPNEDFESFLKFFFKNKLFGEKYLPTDWPVARLIYRLWRSQGVILTQLDEF